MFRTIVVEENETHSTSIGVSAVISFKARMDRPLLTKIKFQEGDVFGTLA
jgi:hypothetical protein